MTRKCTCSLPGKLKAIVSRRQVIAEKLNDGLRNLKGLKTPKVRKNCTHVYYIYQMKIDTKILGVKREIIL